MPDHSLPPASIDETIAMLAKQDYLASRSLATVLFLALKMTTKFLGILPLTKVFLFDPREGMYTTLLMSTGLTFGTICALYGLTNGIIDQLQYTILVTAGIASAVVPTLIAQKWFEPASKPAAEESSYAFEDPHRQ